MEGGGGGSGRKVEGACPGQICRPVCHPPARPRRAAAGSADRRDGLEVQVPLLERTPCTRASFGFNSSSTSISGFVQRQEKK